MPALLVLVGLRDPPSTSRVKVACQVLTHPLGFSIQFSRQFSMTMTKCCFCPRFCLEFLKKLFFLILPFSWLSVGGPSVLTFKSNAVGPLPLLFVFWVAAIAAKIRFLLQLMGFSLVRIWRIPFLTKIVRKLLTIKEEIKIKSRKCWLRIIKMRESCILQY